MSKSTGACNDFAARRRGKSSRKPIPLNFFGGAAVAVVVISCAWTLYNNVFGASIYPAVTASGVESADISPLRTSAKRKNTVALLAAAYPPEPTFAERLAADLPEPTFAERLAGLDRPSVAPSAPANIQANIRIDLPKPQNELPLSPPIVRQVASIPAPTKRGPEPRSPQNKNSTDGELAQRAKATVVASTGSTGPSIFEKLFGKPQPSGPRLAYASADAGVQSDGSDIVDKPSAPYDRMTAVYDISAHMVYMPDGTKLEAHSGLGSMLDDPRHVRERMRGATPPHIYDLAMRESLFHGVPALRLKPVGGEGAIYGRSGLLAHTYMLGPNGDSNGCVSFRDYNAFLQAYKDQRVKRLVVVAHLD
jgi:type VI secretion system (T6SS) effector TldE1-like protein